MVIINTPVDLRRVAENASLPQELRDTIEALYWSVWRFVGGGDPAGFSLEPYGPIAIIEPGDSLESLPGAGRKVTEWANVVEMAGHHWYDVGILHGNCCCVRLFGEAGMLNPGVEDYLAREVRGEEENHAG